MDPSEPLAINFVVISKLRGFADAGYGCLVGHKFEGKAGITLTTILFFGEGVSVSDIGGFLILICLHAAHDRRYRQLNFDINLIMTLMMF